MIFLEPRLSYLYSIIKEAENMVSRVHMNKLAYCIYFLCRDRDLFDFSSSKRFPVGAVWVVADALRNKGLIVLDPKFPLFNKSYTQVYTTYNIEHAPISFEDKAMLHYCLSLSIEELIEESIKRNKEQI